MASAIVTPPIRNSLVEKKGHEPEAKTPTRDWWLYWNSLTNNLNQAIADIEDLENDLANEIRSGPHADRLAAPPDHAPSGALWIETDRNNIVYQVQTVNDAPEWVYVTGAMYGTVIAVDERPADLGLNDVGVIFLSSDSTSVRWMGSYWAALGQILDLGPTPPSQLIARANGQGALSLLCYTPDNVNIGFDTDFSGTDWVARDATCAWLIKQGQTLRIVRSSGNTVGGSAAQTNAILVELSTGRWTFAQASAVPTVRVNGDVDITSNYQKNGVPGVNGLFGYMKPNQTAGTFTVSGGIITQVT